MPGRRVLVAVLVALGAVALAVFGLAPSGSGPVGRVAPALPREHLVGPPVTLNGALAGARGRATLVTFWASWCGPCAREASALERFSTSAAGSGRLIGVNWSDVLSGARSFIKRYDWTFPNLRDAEGTVGNDYRIAVLPTTFVIDSAGRIRAVLRGPQNVRALARAMAAA